MTPEPEDELSQMAIDLGIKFSQDLEDLILRSSHIMAVSGITPRDGIAIICGTLMFEYANIWAKFGKSSHAATHLADALKQVEEDLLKSASHHDK